MDKKLIGKLLLGLVVIVVLIVLIGFIKNVTKHTKFNYTKVYNSVLDSAKEYGKTHKDKLPKSRKETLELTDTFLKSEGYFSGYDKLYDDDVFCKSYVDVFMESSGVYTYIASVDCNNYKRDTIYERVLADNNYGVVEGTGLYALYKGEFITSESKLNDSNVTSKASYVFRGDETKYLYNYISFGNMMWRIIELDENGDLIIMYDGALANGRSWDTRYNGEHKGYTGINDFYVDGLKSTAAKTLSSFYIGGTALQDNTSYNHVLRMINLPMDLCVGKRSSEDEGYDGSIECSEKVKDQNVGLLPAYMFMRASLDEKCTKMASSYCNNYNYLARYNESYWLLTTYSEKSNICLIAGKTISYQECRYQYAIKPVMKIRGDLKVQYGEDGGIGSITNPYKIYSYYKSTVSYNKK